MPAPGKSKRYGSGNLNAESNMAAIAITAVAKAQVHVNAEEFKEPGPAIALSLTQMGRQGTFTINLSNLTAPELQALQDVINEAFALAAPIVRERDAKAQEVFDEGGNPVERIYRALPTVHYREGSVSQHRQGLRDGSEDAPASSRDGEHSDDGLGEPRAVVVERHSGTGRAKNHGTPPS